MAFNKRKQQALAIFESSGWLSPPAFAVLAQFRPIRAAYSYLLRLHRWGLIERRHDSRGLLLYRLATRGRMRLAWLRNGQSVCLSGKYRAKVLKSAQPKRA
jgi:hypothetical protein